MTSEMQDFRILMITPFHKSLRGNTLTSERLQNGLRQRGWKIDLLSLESHNWQNILSLAIKEKHYALIHGFNITHFSRVLTDFPETTHLPLLVTTTGTDINHDIKASTGSDIAKTLHTVKRIVIFDDYFRAVFQQYYPETTVKLVTIPQGIALEQKEALHRHQLGLHQKDFVFLLPSGLRPVKNLELAVDALEKLQPHFPALRLLIVGTIIDKAYGCTLQKRIKNLPWVIYPGEFPHEQMYSIMSLSDVVLNTSHSEGQPQAALEAMSLAKPCLLSAVPGNLNIIEHGREGFYFSNQTGLITCARILMLDKNMRRQMGKNARRLVLEKYSVKKELDSYEIIYNELLSGI